MKLLTVIFLALGANVASAHHGSNGQFNHDIKVDVTGVITDARFVNPHAYIYFTVKGDNGEAQDWRCELRGGGVLKRQGWTTDMFVEGTEITVVGSQARREEFGCYTDAITFADGRTVNRRDVIDPQVGEEIANRTLAKGTPNINGRWVAPERRWGLTSAALEAVKAAWPKDAPFTRRRPLFEATEAGKVVNFDREMNPRFHCQAVNIFHDWWFNKNVNKIEQTNDKIIMTYGFMDIVRTIHLDMEVHPIDITPSRAGHSIGRWQGNTLIIDTVGFTEGWLNTRKVGIKHSDQMHTVEHFNLSGDGQWLVMTYTINDPINLKAPFTAQLTQRKTSAPYSAYDCEDLTEERVKGF